uniref:solute carrier family 22 member 6-like n=1 Tax=Myxine glutinosa TaxID=7769 RepID=UPI00358E0ADF
MRCTINSHEQVMSFADLLNSVGEAGRFQVIHVILLVLAKLLFPGHNLIQNFSAATPRHHCRVPWLENASLEARRDSPWNLSNTTLLRVAMPWEENSPSRCSRYVRPQWQLMYNNSTDLSNHGEIEGCLDGWEFDTSMFSSTIVTEWDLVCEEKVMKQMAQSVYMAGLLVGAIILGGLADKFGRRTILLISYLGLAVSGCCAAFAPSMAVYTAARFFDGMFMSGAALNSFSLGLEWMSVKNRVLYSLASGCAYTTGQIILAGFAYAIRDWRYLQLAVSAPFFLIVFIGMLHVESARWLIFKGRYDDALKCFKKVARINGKRVVLNMEILKRELEDDFVGETKTYTIFDLVRTATLRKRTFTIFFIWFATAFSYYGLALNLQGFKVNIYLLMVLFGLVDYPSKFAGLLTANYIGRRAAQMASLSLAGFTSVALIFISEDMAILRASLAVLGKGFLGCAFNIVYLFTGELFPTVMRQTSVGAGSTMARVGAMLAPLVIHSGEIYPVLPQIIYAVVCLCAGLVALMLPETRNTNLPDTVDDLLQQQKRRKEQQMKSQSISDERENSTSLEVLATARPDVTSAQ